jgi:hypothetical protein
VLPPIPKAFFSSLGALSVRPLSPKQEAKICGKYSFSKRRIYVAKNMHLKSQWVTLWHEAVHVMMTDSGATNVLTHEQAEVLCDAFGNYLTAMMEAGWLTFTVPQETDTRKL